MEGPREEKAGRPTGWVLLIKGVSNAHSLLIAPASHSNLIWLAQKQVPGTAGVFRTKDEHLWFVGP